MFVFREPMTRLKLLRSAAHITAQSIILAPVINSGISTTQESEARHMRSQLF